MTAPHSPWPGPTPRGLGRELVGLLLVLVGLAVLLVLLATVNWRLPVGAAALAAIAGGIYLGRGPAATDDDEGL